jgi:tRNA(adenine34) deaminase
MTQWSPSCPVHKAAEATLAAESISLPEDDERYMRLALDLAAQAAASGEVPVGAVVVGNGEVLGRGSNSRESTGDPTAHAEVLALRAAAARSGSWRLSGATLYVTLEPCPMCAGALVAARVSRVVFGTHDPKAGSCGTLYNLCADPRLNHELAVTRGVLNLECSQALSLWFEARRR